MSITINQYITNPIGKGSAASSLRIIKTEYDARYQALLDIHENFQLDVYKHRESYYFHVLIPSETTKELLYDVVIRVDKQFLTKESNFLNWPMKAISNSPSFVYTFANTFKRNKTLLDEFKSILPSESVTDFAKIRNPHKLMGLEKSIYYACRYIKDTFSDTNELDKFSKKFELKSLLKEIKKFNYVMELKDIDQKRKSEENKKQRELQKRENQKIRNGEQHYNAAKTNESPKTVKNIRKAEKAPRIKKTKRI